RLRHGPASHLRGIAAKAFRERRRRVAGDLLAGEAIDRAAGRDLLPAAVVAASARRPSGLHDEVADLRGEAVRAPEELPVGGDAAADPGADGDEQHVLRRAARPEPELSPRGDVRVVVDLTRKPELA